MSPQVDPSLICIFDPFFLYIKSGAVRGLLGSRHLVVKITDFTQFYPILSGFQRYLRKLERYFTPKRPKLNHDKNHFTIQIIIQILLILLQTSQILNKFIILFSLQMHPSSELLHKKVFMSHDRVLNIVSAFSS